MRRGLVRGRRVAAAVLTVVSLGAAGLAAPAAVAVGPSVDGSAVVRPTMVTRPVITGVHEPGQTLRVSDGAWNGEPTSFSYVWQACTKTNTDGADGTTSTTCRAIGNTVAPGSPSVELTEAELGSFIRARVTARNAAGSLAPYTAPGPVIGVPTAVSRPVISGTPSMGRTLTATPGTWGGWGGDPTGYSFRWQGCTYDAANKPTCTDAPDPAGTVTDTGEATRSTYTLGAPQRGMRMRVLVTATNIYGPSTTQASPAGAAVTGTPPTSTTRPVIGGVPAVGRTLSTTNGQWDTTPTGYRYQWQSCTTSGTSSALVCTNKTGATRDTYAPVEADRGRQVRVLVTATNVAGGTATAVSAATLMVDAPTNTAAPALTLPTRNPLYIYSRDAAGPRVGDTLSTTTGTWAGEHATYTYAWRACDNAVGTKDTCTTISQDPTATLEPAVLGKTIRVLVTATNGLGTTTKASNVSVPTLPASFSGANDTTFRANQGNGDGIVCAVTRYGNARCFGSSFGFFDRALRGVTGVIAVSANHWSVCALTTGSGLRCWSVGSNGDPVEAVVPTEVQMEVQDAQSVQLLGYGDICAVTAGQEVFCWMPRGGGSYKPFGDLKVTTFEADLQYAMCVIATDGTVRCSGGSNVYTPADLGPVKSLTQIQRGRICAITSSDHARCWDPYSGAEDPAMPADLGTVKYVSAMGDYDDGSFAGCAVTTAGTVRCWGNLPGPVPDDLADGTVDVETISIAPGVDGMACALTSSGQARCWGEAYGFPILSPQELETLGPLQSVTVSEFGPVCYLPTDAGLFCTDFANFDGQPLG